MSIQIPGCENNCAQCQKIYIPLHKEYPCPACGTKNKIEKMEDIYDERYIHIDFINELVGSMKYYKLEYGQFTPFSSYTGGMTGNIQRILYRIFDKIEKGKLEYKPGMFDKEIKDYFGPEREYILPNVKDILDEVYQCYLTENFFIVERKEEKNPSLLKKIKKWFRTLVP